MRVVSSLALRSARSPTELTKYFFNPQLDEMKAKLDHVRALGPGTAEEWIKGLAERGRERLAAAIRWEQWEANGGSKALGNCVAGSIERQSNQTRTPQEPRSSTKTPLPVHGLEKQQSLSSRGSPLQVIEAQIPCDLQKDPRKLMT